jgi:ATP-dependent Clp protease ATP-binding subunit ClpC
VAYRATKAAVDLAEKYFHEKPLPSSAEDLLRETISYTLNKGDDVVTSDNVVSVAEERVNIPIHEVEKGEAQKLLHLEETVHQRLVDQEEAVEVVARALREYRSGLAPAGGPIGTFLFVGPTGVGKTELAKTLSEIQFGSEDAMVRFDMSEYQDTESIHRLIGSPDGKTSGSLTDAVREVPYSLVLLDEFEKAHKDILELFLQVFDDGRLTDSLGRTVNFENTIIIATSNAEAAFIVEGLRSGRKMEEISGELRKRLIHHFSPELLNRFSAVVVFKSLSPEDINAIARLHLDDFALQLKESNDITLVVDEDLVAAIARLGYDKAFGARPLTRVISDRLRAPLAEKILAGEVGRGTSIKARLEGDTMNIYADS